MSTRSSRARHAADQRWHKEPVYTPEQAARLEAAGKAARRVDVNGNPLVEVQAEAKPAAKPTSFTPFSWE